jgi:hypothetical protein
MSLPELHPEILIHIFNYVGSSWFRVDMCRLTVCRWWSIYALTACFRDFHVTQKILRRWFSSPYVRASLLLMKSSLEFLELNFKGFQDWESLPGPSPAVNGTRGHWRRELDTELCRLAMIIQLLPRLRLLRIRATSEIHPDSRLWSATTTFMLQQYVQSSLPKT